MAVEFDDPLSWTVEHAQAAGYTLWVFCMAKCHSSRLADLGALTRAGLGRRRIAALSFRCSHPGCGGKGAATIDWWEGERSSWDYGKGQLKGQLPKAPPGRAPRA